MMHLLSGDEKYQKDSRAIGLAIVNQKRQMRKRRRSAKGFETRKDHRRAFAQKAEISMESVNDKVLKVDDDAPIEEVEVSN